MKEHIAEWKKLNLRFNGICTGFLGSEQQINIVSSFIDDFGAGDTVVMVDPVMGDEGRPYATYTPAMCEGMRNLVAKADIITPNLTEACILANRPYSNTITITNALALAHELTQLGPKRVIVTGIEQGAEVPTHAGRKAEQHLPSPRNGLEANARAPGMYSRPSLSQTQ